MIKLRLRELRQSKQLTQEELSKILKIPRSTYANYENGSREPDNNTISLISDYFNVSVDYLFGKTDIKKYTEDILAFNSTEGLTEDDLKLVHQMIQNMRDKNLGKK